MGALFPSRLVEPESKDLGCYEAKADTYGKAFPCGAAARRLGLEKLGNDSGIFGKSDRVLRLRSDQPPRVNKTVCLASLRMTVWEKPTLAVLSSCPDHPT